MRGSLPQVLLAALIAPVITLAHPSYVVAYDCSNTGIIAFIRGAASSYTVMTSLYEDWQRYKDDPGPIGNATRRIAANWEAGTGLSAPDIFGFATQCQSVIWGGAPPVPAPQPPDQQQQGQFGCRSGEVARLDPALGRIVCVDPDEERQQPQQQTIVFAPLPSMTVGDPDVLLRATASSGLPVSFSATGSCLINGATLRVFEAGVCSVTASQPGDSAYTAAADVTVSFTVAPAAPRCEDPIGCYEISGQLWPMTRPVPQIDAPKGSSNSERTRVAPRTTESFSISGRIVEVTAGAAPGSFNYAVLGDPEVAGRMFQKLVTKAARARAAQIEVGTGTAVAIHGNDDGSPVITSVAAGASLSFYARQASDTTRAVLTTTINALRDTVGYFTTTSSGTVSEIGIERGSQRIVETEDPQLRKMFDQVFGSPKPKIRTPGASIGVRGTDLTVSVEEQDGVTTTSIEVAAGLVVVSIDETGNEYALGAGETITIVRRPPLLSTLPVLPGAAAIVFFLGAGAVVLRRRRVQFRSVTRGSA